MVHQWAGLTITALILHLSGAQPQHLPERAQQGLASSALVATRLWGFNIEQVHDSDMAKGTIPSQKDEGLCLLGRARRVLLPPLQQLLMGMEAQMFVHICTPPHAQRWDSALHSNSGGKAQLLLHLQPLGRRLAPLSHIPWPMNWSTASAQSSRKSSSTQH